RAARAVRLGRSDDPALVAHLAENPEDAARWGVLADSIEEGGSPHLADVVRNIGAHGQTAPWVLDPDGYRTRQWVHPEVTQGQEKHSGHGWVEGMMHGMGFFMRRADRDVRGVLKAPAYHV